MAAADDPAQEPVAVHPADALPVDELHGVRRRVVAAAPRSGLRLRGRLYGVPVRVRPAPVGGVRRCVHRLRDRARLRARFRTPAADRVAAAKRHRARLRAGRARTLEHRRRGPHHRRPPRSHADRRQRRRPLRPVLARRAVQLRGAALGLRDRDALSLGAGGAADADAHLHAALPRPRLRAARTAAGMDLRVREVESGDVLPRAAASSPATRQVWQWRSRSRRCSSSAWRSGRYAA